MSLWQHQADRMPAEHDPVGKGTDQRDCSLCDQLSLTHFDSSSLGAISWFSERGEWGVAGRANGSLESGVIALKFLSPGRPAVTCTMCPGLL
jgi:hypothetical protein